MRRKIIYDLLKFVGWIVEVGLLNFTYVCKTVGLVRFLMVDSD